MCNDQSKDQVCGVGAKFCRCIHTLEVDLNDLVEFVIIDEATGFEFHPVTIVFFYSNL